MLVVLAVPQCLLQNTFYHMFTPLQSSPGLEDRFRLTELITKQLENLKAQTGEKALDNLTLCLKD